jgi:hypothetical protein
VIVVAEWVFLKEEGRKDERKKMKARLDVKTQD